MKVEANSNLVKDNGHVNLGNLTIMMTPSIDADYWYFRVHLHQDQYVQAFPKFGTCGIGFAIEDEDWNTNLPFKNCTSKEITDHIWDNHKYPEITKQQCIEAVKLLRKVCAEYMGQELEAQDE